MAGAPRLFRDHDRLLACSNGRFVWRVLQCLMPTNRRKGEVNRGSVVTAFQNCNRLLTYSYRQLIPPKGSMSSLTASYYTRIT